MKLIKLFFIILVLFSCKEKQEVKKELKQDEKKSSDKIKYSTITNFKDTLFKQNIESSDLGSSCSYINSKNEIIFKKGTFEMCFSDTFINYAFVFDKKLYGSSIVAINRNKELIFDAYMFDNGPDYISEGLFRIMRNDKVGYADKKGEIIIEPQFEGAFPFENGKAKVTLKCEKQTDNLEHSSCESKSWFFIDKKGRKIS